VNYDGGAYAIGMKTLEGGETVTYDLRKVRDEQIPDSHGRTIPLEVSSGQVHWSGNGNGMMIGRSEQTDFVAGMSSNYSCMNCCSDNPDENHQTVIPGSATYAVDQSFLFTAAEQFMDCYGHFSEFVFVTNARWSSSNENVATVEQINGNATGASPGTATITARWDDCVNYYNPIFGECRCHTNHYSKSASVTVTAGIDRIQYQSGSDFVDVEGTLYVLNGTTVTFKAIPKPENATFPSGKPVWSGTSGISGTGQTKSVTFNTTSTSSTDYKTVIATAGVSITVNVVVIELTGVLTPDDNFAGHSTTRFGIHEHLTLGFTVTPTGLTAEQIGGLQWQKTSGSGELANAPTNGTGSFNVADSPGSATLQLKLLQGPSKESGPVSNLTVVAPSDGYVLKQPLSGIRHFQNYWSCGFLGNVYVLPNDVSFYNLFFREDDVGATASGWLSFLNGQSHDPGSPQGILNGIGGGLVNGDDQVFSGKYSDSNHGPYATGQVAWAIPWTYSVDFITWHSIRVVDQIASSTSTGRCTISKTGSGSFSSELSDPDSEW